MPTLTTTIEDTAPIIAYSGAGGSDWGAGSSKNDSATEQYSQSSFTFTQTPNANITFSFYGTGVQIYGAKRTTHGLYQVTIDDTIYPTASGRVGSSSNDTEADIFQTSLFSTVALSNGLHTVTMTNLAATVLDIDFITWQTPVGSSNEALLSFTAQDSDSSFHYTPVSAWNTGPPNLGMFSGGSGHVTTTAGSFVEYNFKGAAITLFGPVGPNGAPYSVQLDNLSPANYSTYKDFYRSQMVLFEAGDLDAKTQHTVRITHEGWNSSALILAVDYAQVFTTPSLQKKALSTGDIVGIFIGSVAFFLFIIIAVIAFIRRRSGRPILFSLKPKNFLRKSSRPTIGIFNTSEAFNYRPLGTPSHSASNSVSGPGLSPALIPPISGAPPQYEAQLEPQSQFGHRRFESQGSNYPASPSPVPNSAGRITPLPDSGGIGISPPTSGNASLFPAFPSSSAGGIYADASPGRGSGTTNEPYGQSIQVINVPYTPDGKYRPDLLSSTPMLMSPPQGQGRLSTTQRDTSSTSLNRQLPPTPSQNQSQLRNQDFTQNDGLLSPLPPGARQPALGVLASAGIVGVGASQTRSRSTSRSTPMTTATTAGMTAVDEELGRQIQSQAVLTPLRRQERRR